MFQIHNNYYNFCRFLGDHPITGMTDAVPSTEEGSDKCILISLLMFCLVSYFVLFIV